ncbi:ATPase H(+)-transporting accessory protein 2 [Schistocerca nitens]|uniref:ATPase H(+)-transporting accessory protein 2 n=1 Tax=Schistocerca nitens TaxID=7011 RepID=UPI002118CBC3|nr:ATPase H(+)-transporting accessory protein 2 [Schistocerca nitens]
MKSLWSLFYVIYLVASVSGTGEVVFLHSPKSIVFKGHEVIDQSLLKQVLASSFGFTISKGSDWNGLVLKDPFHLAEAAVVVVVDGVKSLGSIKGHSFPVISDEDESVGWQKLKEKIEMRYPGFNSTLQRIDLAEVSTASDEETDLLNPTDFPVTYLDDSNTEDVEFLRQLHLLNNLGEKEYVENEDLRDGLPDLYWIVFSGLHPVIDLHGEDSPAADESKQLLRDAIIHLKKGFINSYDGQVIVAALTSDVSHTRRARQITEPADLPVNWTKPKNLSKDYSENYPVIFNIILWFMVAFVFSLIAISTAISTMDPGRDSIIYRMTSNRMKKDN